MVVGEEVYLEDRHGQVERFAIALDPVHARGVGLALEQPERKLSCQRRSC